MYQRALPLLAERLGCEPTEASVYERRLESAPEEYASRFLRATGTELLLVDEGFPTREVGTSAAELGELAGCEARPVMRIERVAEEAGLPAVDQVAAMDQTAAADQAAVVDRVAEAVGAARGDGYAALKTIAAYRGGLDLDALGPPSRSDRIEGSRVRDVLLAALEANRATGDPLPVQVHTGFGDADLSLPAARPGLLKPLIERFPETTFVLLHCYPFVREAGWLAHVYANVHFDLSLTIPHVSRPAAALAEALELAPVSKLLYASDAACTPELYLLASTWWRDALGEVLPSMLGETAAGQAAQMILRENARGLYRLE